VRENAEARRQLDDDRSGRDAAGFATSRSTEPPRKNEHCNLWRTFRLSFSMPSAPGPWRSGASRASAALRDRSGLQVKSGRVSAQRRSTDAQDGRICFVAGIIMTWRRDFAPALFPAQGARTRPNSPGFMASFTSPSAYGHPHVSSCGWRGRGYP
jgi:hypothetical protein